MSTLVRKPAPKFAATAVMPTGDFEKVTLDGLIAGGSE
jgi:hypothetical protein